MKTITRPRRASIDIRRVEARVVLLAALLAWVVIEGEAEEDFISASGVLSEKARVDTRAYRYPWVSQRLGFVVRNAGAWCLFG
ncbi:hypothetical protein [Halotalea alkalilenta]|uniref:hypothetical protein n=1 Tax=Halotalea alkalilenta TaxID=376489 RepID=UPI001CBDC100|nr:hypothetical protein [Halotalea alkalilenta]